MSTRTPRNPRAPWGTRWTSGYGIAEAMDVTGLTGKEANELALCLRNWSRRGGHPLRGKLYTWRDGKRYMAAPINLIVNLNHPVMAPYVDDILEAERDLASAREFDSDVLYAQTEDWAEEFGAAYSAHLEGLAEFEAEEAARAAAGH